MSRAAAVRMLLCAWLPMQAAASSSYQEWKFDNSANPAAATISSNAVGVAVATISVGFLGTGWVSNWGGFGSQTGLWDLGGQNPNNPTNDTRGRVLLSVPMPVATSTNSYFDVRLRVVQYVDGFIYTGDLTMSPPGLIFAGRTEVETSGSSIGKWVEDEYIGRISPSPQPALLSITGSAFGTVVSSVEVEADDPVPLPDSLVITSVAQEGQSLAISWSGGIPPYQVLGTTNLLDEAAWQPLMEPVTGNHAQIQVVDPVGFIRVRGSE